MDRKLKNIIFTLIVVIFSVIELQAQTLGNKRALLIGVSENPKWTKLQNNDIPSIEYELKKRNFIINKIVNKKATYDNIIGSLKNLADQTNKGDAVIIFYSGHGVIIQDYNNDEEDGYDEAIIAYNTPYYDSDTLSKTKTIDISKFIIDDRLKIYFDKIRKKAGNTGQVLFIADACFSATLTMGKYEKPYRTTCTKIVSPTFDIDPSGTTEYLLDLDINSKAGMADLFAISAKNAKIEPIYLNGDISKAIGYITFSFTQAIKNFNKEIEYNTLIKKMNKILIEYDRKKGLHFEGTGTKITRWIKK